MTRLLDLSWTGGLTGVPCADHKPKQSAVEGKDERATGERVQAAGVVVHPSQR